MICYLYVWFFTLSLSRSLSLVILFYSIAVAPTQTLWLKSAKFFFSSENIYIYTGGRRWWMHTCFLLAYASVMMIIYQETSVVGSLFSLFLCACFCCSPSSNTILLANSHQFIHRRRKGERGRERERDRARGADKTFIEVVPCDGLSVVRSFPIFFSYSYFFFLLYVKREFYHFPIAAIDFLYWWNIRTFPKRFGKRTGLFCKWKMSKHK
jgi:hypothetical protein